MCMSDCVGCFKEGIQQGGVIVLGGVLDLSADNSSSARHACLTLSNLKSTYMSENIEHFSLKGV